MNILFFFFLFFKIVFFHRIFNKTNCASGRHECLPYGNRCLRCMAYRRYTHVRIVYACVLVRVSREWDFSDLVLGHDVWIWWSSGLIRQAYMAGRHARCAASLPSLHFTRPFKWASFFFLSLFIYMIFFFRSVNSSDFCSLAVFFWYFQVVFYLYSFICWSYLIFFIVWLNERLTSGYMTIRFYGTILISLHRLLYLCVYLRNLFYFFIYIQKFYMYIYFRFSYLNKS